MSHLFINLIPTRIYDPAACLNIHEEGWERRLGRLTKTRA